MIARTVRTTLALVILLHAPEAAAQYSLAVLGVDMGPGPANRAACMASTLKQQVKRAPGFDLVPGKNLDEIKLVFGCFNEAPGCLARAGKSLQVEKLLWGRIEAADGGYMLSLRLLDVGGARVEKVATETVTRKELARTCAAEALDRLTAKLLSTRRASLSIRVNIQGARVTVGPRFIGLSEGEALINSELPPGSHLVQVKAKGYRNWEEQVTLEAGEEKVLEVALQPLALATVDEPGAVTSTDPVLPPTQEGSGTLGWKVAFWTSTAATVGLAIGMGITGAQVLSAEQDKEDLIGNYRQDHGRRDALPPSHEDVCTDPKSAPGGDLLSDGEVTELQDICDRGKSKALVTNVLIGATVAMAVVAGVMYYKAYVSSSDSEAPADETEQADGDQVTWSLTPRAGPDGAGVGVQLRF